MKRTVLPASLILYSVFSLATSASAQGWDGCIDPKNTSPRSTDYAVDSIGDSLFRVTLGISGTVTYGGQNGPCFGPTALTYNTRGRIGFAVGPVGSVQTNFDDSMNLTMGMPASPMGSFSYATIVEDGKQTLFGANGWNTTFIGASDRYIFAETKNGDLQVDLRVDLVGDTSRLNWTLTNTDTANTHTAGLWFGQWVAMLLNDGSSSSGTGPLLGQSKGTYVVVPGIKPPTTEKRFIQAQDPSNFPPMVKFEFGQSNPYGLEVLNGPSPETEDAQGLNSDATQADEFALGIAYFLDGSTAQNDGTFPDVQFGPNNTPGDVTFDNDTGYIQKFYDTNSQLASGSARVITQYFRSTWGAANYFKPYEVTVDAPTLINADLTDPTGLSQPSGGYDIRVWIDNTRGFSTVDKTIELDDVQVTLNLPTGLNLAAGDTGTKVIPRILPGSRDVSFVDFHVIPDGVAFGPLNYSVNISPTPGPSKTITGTIMISATPKLTLAQGANLIGVPFTFSDTSWESVLGLRLGTDFEAYNYDPTQNGYVPSTSVNRGTGTWLVANNALGLVRLQSNPQVPPDSATGTRNIQLQPGWNIISNPYNLPIQVGQLVGVTASNPNQSYTWADLVSQGAVNPYLAAYDPNSGGFNYIQTNQDLILPEVGYFLFVNGTSTLTLNFPPVFQEGLAGSTRSVNVVWPQTSDKWRLQLSARTAKTVDANNYIGYVTSQSTANTLQIMKPPAAPTPNSGVSLAIDAPVNGVQTRLAQAVTSSAVSKEYTVTVTSKEAGDVTLNWPNINTVPKNYQFRLVDTATGSSRVMNQSSGYTFTAQANSTRTFKVQIQTASLGAPVITNMLVTRPSRDRNAPFTIAYTLGNSSTTTVHILNGAGAEIATVAQGRADQAGTNSVTWNLRDNANRNVAPGLYRVEIIAQTADGQRVRRIETINVTR